MFGMFESAGAMLGDGLSACFDSASVQKKDGSTRVSANTAIVMQFFACAGLMPVVGMMMDWHLSQLHSLTLVFTGLATAAYLLGLWSYMRLMELSSAGLVVGATAAYPVVTQLLSVFVLGEAARLSLFVSCAIVVAGMVLLFAEPGAFNRETFWLSLVTVAGWGAFGLFDALSLRGADSVQVQFEELGWRAVLIPVLVVWFLLKGDHAEMRNKAGWTLSILTVVVFFVGNLGYLSAIASGMGLSQVVVIVSCAPVFTYVLSILFLKEKASGRRWLGIACVVAGLVVATML